MSATWHGREPDVRCEWCHELIDRRFTQAVSVVIYPWGHHRRLCASHSEQATIGDIYPSQPILRDPRVALCAILGMLGVTRADPKLYALLAGAAADLEIALDYVEERALYEHTWPRMEITWLPVTGRHEHEWLPWRSGDENRALVGYGTRRCTCGMFEHEDHVVDEPHEPCPIDGCARVAGHVGHCSSWRLCSDCDCQRERGHPGPHMSRTWDAQSGLEIVDEWGNEDPDEDPTTYAGAVGYG